MNVYHTGYLAIPEPDVHYGRINADFGQGFYVTDDPEFARRWAREKRGCQAILNTYDLDLEGLNVKTYQRDLSWIHTILDNRNRNRDSDAVIAPVAADTIYDAMGIVSAGYLSAEEALSILNCGIAYRQIVLKTELAASHLRFLNAEVIDSEQLKKYRRVIDEEEVWFQKAMAEQLAAMQ